jgi:PAS domain S-box-containing protein
MILTGPLYPGMETIRMLILEHDQVCVELLRHQLRKSGLDYVSKVVRAKGDYQDALSSFRPDIILSDYAPLSPGGRAAFRLRQEASPETPFIIVADAIGEEHAVELIRAGVTDYVLKDRMHQMSPKIHRALKETAELKRKEAAELKRRQREQRLQRMVDLSLDVICTLDQAGRFVTVGAASEFVWGYLPEELVGRRAMDLVHQGDKQRTYRAMADLRNGIDMVNFENRYIRKDGETVTLLWSVRWNPDERLGYSVARDATEIKKAEEKIKNNEKRFRTLLQNSADGLTLVAADGTVIERSPSVQRILGFSASEALGKLRLDLVHPDDLPVFHEVCAQAMNNPDEVLTLEYRFLMPDGSYKWIETTLHNQLQEPAVGAIVLNFRDITARKTAEIALEKSEEKYRSLFHLSPTPMWVFDVETLQFLDVNEAAIKHYGYSKEEFFAMTLPDIRPKEDAGKLKEMIKTLKGAKGHYRYVARHVKRSGEVIDVDIKNSLVELGGREIRLAIVTDISQRLKYIQAIEGQNAKLREIAWIQSHVVRAPLSRLMGLVSLLENSHAPERMGAEDVLSYISASARELDEIIRDIVRKTEQVKDQPIFREQPDPWS